MSAVLADFATEVRDRLDALDQEARAGGLDPAVDLIVSSLQRGGVVQVFGTGHSQAFAMEVAGRAGGLIPTHAIVLRDVVLRGDRDVSVLEGGTLERDESVADELYSLYTFEPADVFMIASNSGVNGSIVASPYGARLSITTSAISESRLPLLCLGVTALVCSRLVTAMTGWPSALARSASPTIDPLTPELEAIMKTSAGSKEYSS